MGCILCRQNRVLSDFVKENFEDIEYPIYMNLELTAKCNLNCVHCYAKGGRSHKDFSFDEFKALFDVLVDRGLMETSLTGGEIFLRPDFKDIYLYAKAKGVLVALLSNITLLSQSHIDMFKEYPVEIISTTIYGCTEETYERVTQVKGSYKTFMNGLELLSKNNIRFELKFVALQQNIEDVYKVNELGKALKAETVVIAFGVGPMNDGSLEPLDYRVPPEKAFEFDIQDEDRRMFWQGVAKQIASGEIGLRPIRAQQKFQRGLLYPCAIAHQSAFITSDLKLQGCVKASYRQFDLRLGTFDEGWAYIRRELAHKKSSPTFKCAKCEKIRFCEQCTANFAQRYGDEERIDSFYCEIGDLRKKFVDDEVKKLLV